MRNQKSCQAPCKKLIHSAEWFERFFLDVLNMFHTIFYCSIFISVIIQWYWKPCRLRPNLKLSSSFNALLDTMDLGGFVDISPEYRSLQLQDYRICDRSTQKIFKSCQWHLKCSSSLIYLRDHCWDEGGKKATVSMWSPRLPFWTPSPSLLFCKVFVKREAS